MSLTNEERQTLVLRELKKAHEAYEDIEILMASKRWNGAANRLYYAVFHATTASSMYRSRTLRRVSQLPLTSFWR